MYFELDNDDMERSKRRSLFISLIFTLKCFTKSFVIRNQTDDQFLQWHSGIDEFLRTISLNFDIRTNREGREGVKWELGLACFCIGKMGFRSLGLRFESEKKAKMGMGLVFY